MEIFFKKMKRVSSYLLILAVIFMFFTTCSDFTVGGGETTLTINMGGGGTNNGEGSGRSAMPWPPTDYPGMLEQIDFEITLTGSRQTINRSAKGGETINVTVNAGRWNVAIKAFYNGSLYAEGSNWVDVIAGRSNAVNITMNKAYWYMGDGPYFISTAADLADFAFLVNSGNDFAGETIILANDIDLCAYQSGTGWTPIGTSAAPFRGTFDGSGYTISNLTIVGGGYLGLFGQNNGTVKNLGIVSGSVKTVSGTWNTGGIAGFNSGRIENCYFTGTVEGVNRVGGIAGRNEGTITNCYSTATVSGSDIVGGIVGHNYNGSVSYCYNTGDVSGSNRAGGIVGYIQLNGTVSNCVSLGLEVNGPIASRVVGSNESSHALPLTSNAARIDLLVNGDPVSGTSINRHGEDIIISDTTYGNVFAGWNFSASGAWEYPAGVSAATVFAPGNNLPILHGFTVAQNHTM